MLKALNSGAVMLPPLDLSGPEPPGSSLPEAHCYGDCRQLF